MPPPIEGDSEDDRTVRLREDPEVLARRERSVRVVKRVMAGVAALFLVGLIVKLREAPPPAPPPPVFAHSASQASAEPATLPSTVPTAPVASGLPVAADAAASAPDASPSDAATASADASPADAAQALAAGADVDASVDAKALKKACQRALDSGKIAEAIEKGEASVAADPTDGEAWLLLGASYEQKGRIADAKGAYKSCVQKGKRGPVGECAALAH